MITQAIKKGRHHVKLHQMFWLPVRVKMKELVHIHISGPGLRYDAGSNQKDWNKMPAGDYFSFLPHGRTAMIGWRYNPLSDAIEFTHYYHNVLNTELYQAVGSVPGYINEDNVLSIPIHNDSVSVAIETQIINKSVTKYISEINYDYAIGNTVQYDKIWWFKRRSNGYAGGQVPAQGDLKFEIEFIN